MKVRREAFSGTFSRNEKSPMKSVGESTGPRRKPAGCPGVSGPPPIGGRGVSSRSTAAVSVPLPATPYEACDKRTTRVRSLSLVRYRSNDYSVPVAWGHREVLVKGFVEEVVICAASEVIARHVRS